MVGGKSSHGAHATRKIDQAEIDALQDEIDKSEGS